MKIAEYNKIMEIQIEIGVWSNENFGDQAFHNPLLGVTEESGEFFEAKTLDDMYDAAADAMIFLCDFLERFNKSRLGPRSVYLAECVDTFERKGNWEIFKEIGVFNAIPIFTGKISRSVLKLEQGIRKNEDHFKILKEAIACLWYSYDRVINYCAEEEEATYSCMHEAFIATWKNVVQKRDWTPETKVARKESDNENRDK